MKTLFLVRHGEAGDERFNEVHFEPKNQYDKPLTKLGINQAVKLGSVFSDIKFDHSFTSDYLRAIETFQYAQIKATHHRQLTEIRELYCECIGKNLGNTDLGEFEQQKQRVQAFIDKYLNPIGEGEQVIVVAHGCFILYLLKQLLGISMGQDLTHASITKLVFKQSWQLVYFNDSQHLFEPVSSDIAQIFAD